MTTLVQVSSIDTLDKLKSSIEEFFKKEKFEEITQAVGMYSLIIDPQNTMIDQTSLYHSVLNMIKDRISKSKGKDFGTWYVLFPKLLDKSLSAKEVVADAATLDVLTSHRNAFGPFKSLEEFFFWALDDRRLTLEQIVKYIERTAAKQEK
jgi:hypothetical protein